MIFDFFKYPFKINFKTDGWINIEKDNQETSTARDLASNISDSMSSSRPSTVPHSLLSTPREPIQFLPNVDLTLSSQVKKADIKTYLVELFSKCK